MEKIIIKGIKGYYYVEEGYLIYCYSYDNNNIKDYKFKFCELSDLSDLTEEKYNELVRLLNKYYPNYNIDLLI
tara:strand:- start:339 stop:557 length:219 start_codon:yes stop_codon:yes gene_type:complete